MLARRDGVQRDGAAHVGRGADGDRFDRRLGCQHLAIVAVLLAANGGGHRMALGAGDDLETRMRGDHRQVTVEPDFAEADHRDATGSHGATPIHPPDPMVASAESRVNHGARNAALTAASAPVQSP